MARSADILVLAAFPPELVGLYATAGHATEGHATAGHAVKVELATVGIGAIAAAGGALVAIAECGPRSVVLVGTCGAYPGSSLEIGDVVVAESTFLAEPEVLARRAAFPDPMTVRLSSDVRLTSELASDGAVPAVVATTLAVTTDDELARCLSRHARVEHLEAFAVAAACARAGVPFTATLGVANVVGSRGRAEWRLHHEAAGRAACDHVARWIRTRSEPLGSSA